MTLPEFHDLMKTVDPGVRHYRSKSQDKDYTTWREYKDKARYANNRRHADLQLIQVDRYTTQEYDPVVAGIHAALTEAQIPYEYLVTGEARIKASGGEREYIHHIFDCEVM